MSCGVMRTDHDDKLANNCTIALSCLFCAFESYICGRTLLEKEALFQHNYTNKQTNKQKLFNYTFTVLQKYLSGD